MKTLFLAVTMASTVLTPAVVRATVAPEQSESRTERSVLTPVHLVSERAQSRRPVRQARRGTAARAERRVNRRARGRVNPGVVRRGERRIGRAADRRVTRQLRRYERRVDRRIDARAARRFDRRLDRRFDRRFDQRFNSRFDRRVDPRLDRGFDDRLTSRFDRRWRQDRRFDYLTYRRLHRGLFDRGPYLSPYHGLGYTRFIPGLNIRGGFFNNRFIINDPFRYRLPPVNGRLRWIRYYDDALLVDTRDGHVADVVYDLFY